MPAFCYDETRFSFPPVDVADEEGLVLIGGAVTSDRVLEAYRKGIFPWYNDDEVPLWWSPDPRFVLFPAELHISKSMKKMLAKTPFEFKMDTAFGEVLAACANTKRHGQDGTWITPQMIDVYTRLHTTGHAHSAETWVDGQLVGGLYGIRMGQIFFAESMFSHQSNASKFALIKLVETLRKENVVLIDCQVYSEHVESMGARLIQRQNYLDIVGKHA